MIKVFIVDGAAVYAAEADAVRLLEDCAHIGVSEYDEVGTPLNGETFLCFNLDSEILELPELPDPWIPHAYILVDEELVRDEDSAAWKAYERERAEAWAALVRQYDGHVEERIEARAREMGYGNPNNPNVSPIDRAVSYAEEPAVPKFQTEGRALRAWRSLYWAACWPVLEAVRLGQRPLPTPAELLAELDAAAPPP